MKKQTILIGVAVIAAVVLIAGGIGYAMSGRGHTTAVHHVVRVQTARPAPTKTVTATPTAPPVRVQINNNATPAPAAPAQAQPPGDLTNCGTGTYGENVYANANTSCPFALNVEAAYVQGGYWGQQNEQGSFDAYSPVTDQTYLMTSVETNGLAVVTGGNDAMVEFDD